MELKGKVALVTGAALGIGKAIAEILLKNGAKVSLLDCNQPEGEAAAAALGQLYGPENVLFLHCDVTSGRQLEECFNKTLETFQRLDIVCNNAGIFDERNWEKCVSINLVGMIRGSKLALQHMSKEKGAAGGVIVNVASLAGYYPMEGGPVYTATKYGVVGYTKALSLDCMKNHGVRVNALCPSIVDTRLVRSQEGDGRKVMDNLIEKLGTLLTPAQIAEGLLELVLDQSRNGAMMKMFHDGRIEYEDQAEVQPAEA